MEISGCILIAAVLVVFAVVMIWKQLSKLRLPEDTLDVWNQQGRTIHHRPVLAAYYGSVPRDSFTHLDPDTVVIGVVDRQVAFVKHQAGFHESFIDFQNIRWIGTREITVMQGKYSKNVDALILHYEDRKGWYVAVFVISGDTSSLLEVIGEQTGLTPHYLKTGREDFGPHAAERMAQDIYGHWQPVFSVGATREPGLWMPGLTSLSGLLYLAPDRLVYDRRTLVLLAQIRSVELYEKGGLHKFNPFNEELLRIEYDEDGQHQVAGFLVRSGRAWADTLHLRLNMPVAIHEGRKKKAESV